MIHLSKFNKRNLSPEKEISSFFIKCPIFGEINFNEDQIWIYELVNTKLFQRLNKIKQLNLCYENFPGATHTRLMHSLGVYEITRNFISELIIKQSLKLTPETQIIIDITLASAILHDIGHAPHCHGFENYIKQYKHEKISINIITNPSTKINQILQSRSIHMKCEPNYYIKKICDLITNSNKDPSFNWCQDLISSQLDVDRLDFLNRDSKFTGAIYFQAKPTIFSKWSLIIQEKHLTNNTKEEQSKYINKLAYPIKVSNNIYYFLFCRYLMYKEIYHNKYSLYQEKIIQLLIHRWLSILPPEHKKDTLYQQILQHTNNKEFDINLFINFTDQTLDQIINSLPTSTKDPLITSYFHLYNHQESLSDHTILQCNTETHKIIQTSFPNLKEEDLAWITIRNIQFYDPKNPILLYNNQTNKTVPYICRFNENSEHQKHKYAIISKKTYNLIKNKLK